MKQQAVISSQEAHLQDLKQRYQVAKEQTLEMSSQIKHLKEQSEAIQLNELNS